MSTIANLFGIQRTLWLCFLSIASTTCFSQTGDSVRSGLEYISDQERQIQLIALFGLIPIVVAFSFITFVFYRRKREAHFKKTEAELKLSIAEVELKALKAQINPHFIFNCMNSIHHYMHKNDISQASDYLIKFSQLIRMVLENSSFRSNTLREELQTLELYIQLEQLRLESKFSYSIEVDPDIDKDNYELPGFLIQPFVENAIWHELTKVKADGRLTIRLSKDTTACRLICHIISMGTGRRITPITSVLPEGVKKTSLGMNLVRERIDVLNRTSSVKAFFTTKDISVLERNFFGYHVELSIPSIEDNEISPE